ncbi:MAG: RIO1 family regulatory kinase/ATPase [Candidatus Hodarchaeota archaeon]
MIDLHRLANILREITVEEIQVLTTLEEVAPRFEYVPLPIVEKRLDLSVDDSLFFLTRLNKEKLVQRQTEPYLGYRISRAGYDILALHTLATKDIILSLGQKYGVGKEATVYRALDANGNEVAVKFLRWGRSSFKSVRRLRSLKTEILQSWAEFSKRAADREFTALRVMYRNKGKVPKPIALNRHVIVMSKMDGVLLRFAAELNDPHAVLTQILQQLHLAYHQAKIIHGDLSEYNVFVNEKEQITLFDWPQWQPITHPNALWLLKRDIANVLKYFKRKFRIITDVQKTLEMITGTNKRKYDYD